MARFLASSMVSLHREIGWDDSSVSCFKDSKNEKRPDHLAKMLFSSLPSQHLPPPPSFYQTWRIVDHTWTSWLHKHSRLHPTTRAHVCSLSSLMMGMPSSGAPNPGRLSKWRLQHAFGQANDLRGLPFLGACETGSFEPATAFAKQGNLCCWAMLREQSWSRV